MSTRRTGRRTRRKSVDTGAEKWKNKIWLEVRAPDYVDDKVLGETPTSDLEMVIGRTIDISLMDLTGSFKDLNYHLTFRISNVTGNIARTQFYGQELSRDFRRSQIRNHRSQIEGIFNLKLIDESKIRLKMFIVTPVRAHSSVKKEIRDAVHERLIEITKDMTFPTFVNKLISYELREDLLPYATDVFPIKILEVSKVKVIRYPEGTVEKVELEAEAA